MSEIMHPFLEPPERLDLPVPHWLCRWFGWHKWQYSSTWVVTVDGEQIVMHEYRCTREGCSSYATVRGDRHNPLANRTNSDDA